jgi:hypothetical protein
MFVLRGTSNPALWTPTSLSATPSFWYNDSSTLTVPTGNEVSAWESLGGANFELQQNASGNRPARVAAGLNSRRTVNFDGSNDRIATVTTQARDGFRNVSAAFIAAVYKKAATDGGANKIIGINYTATSASRLTLACSGAGANEDDRPRLVVRRLDGDSAASLAASTGGNTAWQIVVATIDWSTGDGTLYVNGTQDAQNLSLTSSGVTSNTQANLAFNMGAANDASQAADVEIAEYMQSAFLPSGTDIEKLFGYMAYRWGLQSVLPSLHPYKSVPPYL